VHILVRLPLCHDVARLPVAQTLGKVVLDLQLGLLLSQYTHIKRVSVLASHGYVLRRMQRDWSLQLASTLFGPVMSRPAVIQAAIAMGEVKRMVDWVELCYKLK
jgi:hypothetical protein